MKKLALLLSLFSMCDVAHAAGPFIWNGIYAKNLDSGGMTNPDGTVSLPSFTFINDLDTGIFRKTTNVLGFATNGVEGMIINASGQVGINAATPGAQLAVTPGAAGTIGAIIKGASSQSANLTEWQNSSSTVLAKVDASGNITGASFTPTGFTTGSVVFAGASGVLAQDNTNFFWDDTNNYLGLGIAAPLVPLHVKGFTTLNGSRTTVALDSGTSTDPTTIQFLNGAAIKWLVGNRAIATTPNDNFALLNAAGVTTFTSTQVGNTGLGLTAPLIKLDVMESTNTGATNFESTSSTANATYGLAISTLKNTNASQGPFLQLWGVASRFAYGLSSSGNMIFRGTTSQVTDPVGTTNLLALAPEGRVGINSSNPVESNYTLFLKSLSTGSVGVGIRAIASQSANLVEWQNSAGTVLSAVDAGGFLAIGTSTTSSMLTLDKARTATPSATGSYINTGTNTFTDSSTAGSGTAAIMAFNAIGLPGLAATNSSVTTTNAYSLYLAGSPGKGTNNTVTNSIALGIAAGAVGAQTNSYAIFANAQTGATANYAAALMGGNVGIGTSAPASTLDVKGTLKLSGSSSGAVGFAPAAAAGSVTYTLPSADGASRNVLATNGSGTLSWQGELTQSGMGLVKSAGQLLGTNTNDSAAAGYVGEILTTNRVASNAISLTSDSGENIGDPTSITLTPGQWTISGTIVFNGNATAAITALRASVDLDSQGTTGGDVNGVPTAGEIMIQQNYPSGYIPNGFVALQIPSYQVTVATATTKPLFLVAKPTFTGAAAAVTGFGYLQAVRTR